MTVFPDCESKDIQGNLVILTTKPFLKNSYMVTDLRSDCSFRRLKYYSIRCMERCKCFSPWRALILFDTSWDWGSNLAFKLPVLFKTSLWRNKTALLLTFPSTNSMPSPSIFWLLTPRRTPFIRVVRNSNSTSRSVPTLYAPTWREKGKHNKMKISI